MFAFFPPGNRKTVVYGAEKEAQFVNTAVCNEYLATYHLAVLDVNGLKQTNLSYSFLAALIPLKTAIHST